MNFIKIVVSIVLISILFSCENEVEINAEFEEKTFALGLINAGSDTQFVKITKTFLDNETNAIDLAQDPNNLYYDSLDVTLNELNSNNNVVEQFKLTKILRPKGEGLFTTERNEAYYTDADVKENVSYTLTIDKLDGSAITSGQTNVSRGVKLKRPNPGVNGKLTFINVRGQIIDYRFEFETTSGVGEFAATLIFNYMEVINVDSVVKSIEIPLTSFLNSSLNVESRIFILDGQKFFNALEANISASINPPKRLIIDKGMDIIIEAADADYTLYRDVNGPIDGLAQTRPDFTNITNGIGLFASRSRKVSNVNINGDTRNYIIATYGDRVNNLSEYRGFQF